MNRYPGVKPFDPSEQALFFGRDRDIADLSSLVRVEKLAVLFGKSGYGKSSLLNAGVLPRMKGIFAPIEVRLGEYTAGQSLTPLETLRRRVQERTTPRRDMAFVAALEGGTLETALWRQFKTADGGGSEGFLLVFDQFEEFFSYPPDQQADFKAQLAALLHEEMPESLREAARDLPREQRRLLAAPPMVRVLLALRSDRLHELDRLKDALPAILHKRYELRALSREQAREAIIGPALLTDPRPDLREGRTATESVEGRVAFDCPPFEYREDALQHILTDLTKSNTGQQGGVEAFQLQILCDSIESMVAAGRIPDRDGNGLPDVAAADLPPNFDAVYGAYYERRLSHLPEQHRAPARLLIEDGLVRYDPATDTKRRLSVDGDALLASFARHGLTAALLTELEKTYLLRREPNTLGGYNYELSHDTLLEPVVAARKRREAEEAEQKRLAEEAAERERLRAEAEVRERQLANERRKRRRANLIAAAGILLALLAGGASVFAYLKQKQATEALRLAKISEEAALKAQGETANALKLAEENAEKEQAAAKEAQKQTDIAKSALKKADDNLILAKKEEDRAKKALEQVAKEQKATEAQRQKALKNLAIAEEKTKEAETERKKAEAALLEVQAKSVLVVKSLLKDARRDVLGLDYAAALEKLTAAADIGQMPDSVGLALMEIAYFHTEADSLFRARRITAAVSTLLGKKINTNSYTQDQLRAALRGLAPERYAALERRYYPDMVFVKGGICPFGKGEKKDTVGIPAPVADFKMARTETTFWQYGLFCAHKQRKIAEKAVDSWGYAGHDPIINVSWYDAVEYANWLSAQRGLIPAYTIDSLTQDLNNKNSRDDVKWTVTPVAGANGYRLPTETEWEYATRGGDPGDGTIYSGSNELNEVAWNNYNSKGRTQPVQRLQPNRLGLYDMSGNVWEWCWDWYADYPAGPPRRYAGPKEGSGRCLRGGAWYYYLDNDFRVGYRNVNYADDGVSGYGFRLSQD